MVSVKLWNYGRSGCKLRSGFQTFPDCLSLNPKCAIVAALTVVAPKTLLGATCLMQPRPFRISFRKMFLCDIDAQQLREGTDR